MKKEILLFFISCTSLMCIGYLSAQNNDPREIYCSSVDGLRVRLAPNLEVSNTTVQFLGEGETVYYLGVKSTNQVSVTLRKKLITDSFYLVRTMKGVEGWVFGGALVPGRVSGLTDWEMDQLRGKVKKKVKLMQGEGKYLLSQVEEYDLLGRKISQKGSSWNSRPSITYIYDIEGKRKNQSSYTCTYDQQGRLATYHEIMENWDLEYRYQYDSQGRLSQISSEGMMSWCQTRYSYDDLGVLKKKIWSCTSDVLGEEEENTVYYYNSDGYLYKALSTYFTSMGGGEETYKIRYKVDVWGNIIEMTKEKNIGEYSENYRFEYEYWE